MENDIQENKNANNKVDILYNFWLGMIGEFQEEELRLSLVENFC
jgi:hypothetical protein